MRGGVTLFSLNSQCLGQTRSALLEGGQWWGGQEEAPGVSPHILPAHCTVLGVSFCCQTILHRSDLMFAELIDYQDFFSKSF